MAVDYFLKLDGIEGESTDSKHGKEIQVESFSWGASNQGTMGKGGGGGSGRADVTDIHFQKWTDSSSPLLMKACLTGEHIKNAVLTARKQGGKGGQVDFMTATMTEAIVTGYQISGSGGGDGIPADQVSLNFSKIEFKYMEQKADGGLAGAKTAKFDRATNLGT